MKERYRKYSTYLKEKYGEKVYKLPVNLPLTCPNRDGVLAQGGCTFCSEVGTAFENLSSSLEIKKQLELNKKRIGDKYGAKKFIAYFQNFSNTYMPINQFKESIEAAMIQDIVEISVSTRPDCISDDYLDVLSDIQKQHAVNISIELGLQSMKHETLKKINRGHGFAEFLDAVLRIKKHGFNITVHLIGNLPWDSHEDFVETGKVMSALGVDQVKIHSLFILEDTVMGKQYENKAFEICSKEEYIERIIEFIKILDEKIVIQRLLGRAPVDEALFCNWNTSWWKIMNRIEERLEQEDIHQGMHCNYLNGKALRLMR